MSQKSTAPEKARTSSLEGLSTDIKIVLAVLAGSAFVMILNETILSVALPSIMADFAISATTAQWLTTGFMLTMAVVIPVTGFLLKRFTTKAIFTAALSFFVIGTVVAALAPTFLLLLLGRVLQASGTAIIMPLLMTFALTVVPANRRGTIMGLISVVIAVAPALGPTISGFILNSLTWHWLFWIMVPLAAIALGLGAKYIRNMSEPVPTPIDVLSVCLAAIGFGGLVYALSSMSTIIDGEGTERMVTVAIAVIGLASVILFVARQVRLERKDRELLNLRPFSVANFSFAVVVLLIVFACLLGSVTVLPIFLQTSLGVTALTTGLLMLPGGLMNAVLSPIVGRIYDAIGPRPLLWPGILIAAGTMFAMSRLDNESSITEFIIIHIVFSISLAMMISSLMTTALGSLPKPLYGHGSAILNTLQQLAGAAGTALLVLALTRGTESAQAEGAAIDVAMASGSHDTFLIATALALVGFVVSLFVKPVPAGEVEVAQSSAPHEHEASR